MVCRYDDLIEEENDIVQEALRRLSPQEQYRRAYRIRIAQQCGVTHTELPREQWIKPEDVTYPRTPVNPFLLNTFSYFVSPLGEYCKTSVDFVGHSVS